jgi:2-iminobutanoate/2-iminopropanoate deaminase
LIGIEEPMMLRRYITSADGLAAAPSPISQAVVAGTHCYISGQLAVDAQGVFRSGTAAEEARAAFRNVFAAAEAAGFTAAEIAFVDIAFIDLADVPAVNALYAELFAEGRRPARTIYQVAALPYGGRVKVQAVVVRSDDDEPCPKVSESRLAERSPAPPDSR